MEETSKCQPECKDCEKDIARYNELIEKLSAMHREHSTDPETLCTATFREFDSTHSEYAHYPQMQGELFQIANCQKLAWARI